MTPSEQAKEFARSNGFGIEPVGRRYSITRGIEVVAEVGGYPAAINAMRKWIDAFAIITPKSLGLPLGGPWHVIFNGITIMKYGYPTRADALKAVRRGYSGVEGYHGIWRNAIVTIEYRPS
jgi:hypothetical protein